MKQSSRFIILSMAFIGMFCLTSLVTATDLTTFGDVSGNELDGRIARYTTYIGGQETADTVRQEVRQGLYDYVSYPRSSKMTFRMNNGVTDGSLETSVNTFNEIIQDPYEEPYETAFGTEDGYPYDFFGYKFKQASTITSIQYDQWVYNDGGTFATTPDVQVLSGGTWTTVSASWSTPYNNAFGERNESYTITLASPATNAMGVRLIGDALDQYEDPENPGTFISSPDTNGFVSVTELQVTGTANVESTIDLSTNLAFGQTSMWTHGASQKGVPETLTDGVCTYSWNPLHYDTTYNAEATATEDFVGVEFAEPQSDVAAIGAVMVMFMDGGYFTSDTLRVEYGVMDPEWGVYTWTTVTGLDLGSYDDNYATLKEIADTNQPNPHPDRFLHSELLTFDTIEVDIDAIRMIGTAEYADDPTKGDGDGFIGMMEFEVFAALATQPEYPAGDANKDYKVDASDATILAGNWQAGPNASWEMGDFNGDGFVDASDATILAGNWQFGTGGTAVPEPSMILLLLAAGLALLPRWIRR